MTKVQIRSGNKPIVVHCNDTVTRSGMFCAIATTIERCKTEGVVDVFQVVKALRIQKPGAVPTVVSVLWTIAQLGQPAVFVARGILEAIGVMGGWGGGGQE